MTKDRVKILHQGRVLIQNCWHAKGLWERTIGLMGKKQLKNDEALLINSCKQVHTHFMRFPIDVVFLNKENEIIKIQEMKPWKISPLVLQARKTLELTHGFCNQHKLTEGVKLEIEQ